MHWRNVRANLKALRKRDGLTQAAAAAAIGVQLPSWGKWESDSVDRNPSAESLDKIAKLFNVTIDALTKPPAASSRTPGPSSFKRKASR